MSLHLKKEGSFASRDKIRRLMRIMGIRAIYQKPNTSKKNNQHKIYPYLLRDKVITVKRMKSGVVISLISL